MARISSNKRTTTRQHSGYSVWKPDATPVIHLYVLGFMIQQISLAPQTATIPRQFVILPNDPMARNDDGDSVIAVGPGNRSDRFRIPDYSGLFLIGAR